MRKQIEIYQKEDGSRPYLKWLESLSDGKAIRIIQSRITRMREGNFGDTKNVGEGVFEARIDYGPGYRLYFGEYGKTIVVLFIGGDKRTQKKDIEKAKIYKKDYEERL